MEQSGFHWADISWILIGTFYRDLPTTFEFNENMTKFTHLTRRPTCIIRIVTPHFIHHWLDSPWWALAFLSCAHSSLLRATFFQLLTPNILISWSKPSSHRNFGLPTLLAPSGLVLNKLHIYLGKYTEYKYFIQSQQDATLTVLFISNCKITLRVSDAFCVHHQEY